MVLKIVCFILEFSSLNLIVCSLIFVQAIKQKSWMASNLTLMLQSNKWLHVLIRNFHFHKIVIISTFICKLVISFFFLFLNYRKRDVSHLTQDLWKSWQMTTSIYAIHQTTSVLTLSKWLCSALNCSNLHPILGLIMCALWWVKHGKLLIFDCQHKTIFGVISFNFSGCVQFNYTLSNNSIRFR